MPMNMGQMGGPMQGTINPNLNQVYVQHRPTVTRDGKVHPSGSMIGQPSAIANPPVFSQYQSSEEVPGSFHFYKNPAHRDTYSNHQMSLKLMDKWIIQVVPDINLTLTQLSSHRIKLQVVTGKTLMVPSDHDQNRANATSNSQQ